MEEQVVHCNTFKFLGSYTPYGDFMDGHDGYWYGFANQANSSGNATMYWIKIKKDDYSMTEGVWTLSNAHLKAKALMLDGEGLRVVLDGFRWILLPKCN